MMLNIRIEALAAVAFSARGILPTQEARIGALMAKAVGRERKVCKQTPKIDAHGTAARVAFAEPFILERLATGPDYASSLAPGSGISAKPATKLLVDMERRGLVVSRPGSRRGSILWSLAAGGMQEAAE